MTYYYVCNTPACVRNKPRLYVQGDTVKSRGHACCLECGRLMERRRRPLKGPNTKRSLGKGLVWRTSTTGTGSKATPRKPFRKRMYKR
jgi:hypothetical protein